MSILIKGMEMPVTCCHCPLMGYDPDIEWNDGGRETQGAHICVLTHELIDNTKREDHCPLVPVPPHGRLIDADALMEIISKVIGINASIDQRNEATDQERRCLWWFEEQVNIAPTIIPASFENPTKNARYSQDNPAEEGET